MMRKYKCPLICWVDDGNAWSGFGKNMCTNEYADGQWHADY